jgi:hypothetical protein
VSAALHRVIGREFSISRSEPCRIGGSGSADFVLCAYAIQIEHQAALRGFDLEMRVITRRYGRLCAQSCEFAHSDALHLAMFNKLMVDPRGTMLAVVFEQIAQRQRRGRPGCLLQGGAHIIVGRCAFHCSGMCRATSPGRRLRIIVGGCASHCFGADTHACPYVETIGL